MSPTATVCLRRQFCRHCTLMSHHKFFATQCRCKGQEFFLNFLRPFLVVTVNLTTFYRRHSPASSLHLRSLCRAPVPSPFWCDPSFTPTYKAFYYQGVRELVCAGSVTTNSAQFLSSNLAEKELTACQSVSRLTSNVSMNCLVLRVHFYPHLISSCALGEEPPIVAECDSFDRTGDKPMLRLPLPLLVCCGAATVTQLFAFISVGLVARFELALGGYPPAIHQSIRFIARTVGKRVSNKSCASVILVLHRCASVLLHITVDPMVCRVHQAIFMETQSLGTPL